MAHCDVVPTLFRTSFGFRRERDDGAVAVNEIPGGGGADVFGRDLTVERVELVDRLRRSAQSDVLRERGRNRFGAIKREREAVTLARARLVELVLRDEFGRVACEGRQDLIAHVRNILFLLDARLDVKEFRVKTV